MDKYAGNFFLYVCRYLGVRVNEQVWGHEKCASGTLTITHTLSCIIHSKSTGVGIFFTCIKLELIRREKRETGHFKDKRKGSQTDTCTDASQLLKKDVLHH